MPAPRTADVRSRLAGICLALPETSRCDMGDHSSFSVRKKIFVYFLDNHHGDGIVSVACKALPGDHTFLANAQPERFYLPAYIGPRGWVALRLDRGPMDWEEVAELVACSYRLLAPKTLAATLRATPARDRSGSPGAPAKSSRTRRPPLKAQSPAKR